MSASRNKTWWQRLFGIQPEAEVSGGLRGPGDPLGQQGKEVKSLSQNLMRNGNVAGTIEIPIDQQCPQPQPADEGDGFQPPNENEQVLNPVPYGDTGAPALAATETGLCTHSKAILCSCER